MNDTKGQGAMDITVAICTWNRADQLDQTLSAMMELSVPESVCWELLVVNNNCTDNTNEVIDRYPEKLPIQMLLEPKSGLSNARNCAVAHARAPMILWTDDDVLVQSDWIARYLQAMQEYPEADYFGGTVVPRFSGNPPLWLERNLKTFGSAYALRQSDSTIRPFRTGERPFGANMMIRTECLKQVPFNPYHGRKQKEMLSADETTVIRQLETNGSMGVWVGSACVFHSIEETRMTDAYLRSFYAGVGRGYVRTHGPPDGLHLLGVPWEWIWRFSRALVVSFVLRSTKNRAWARAYKEVLKMGAMIGECRRPANSQPNKAG